ncbi:MAG: hypothetical protein ABIX01_23010 [Chitinophagaceae bacterium]
MNMRFHLSIITLFFFFFAIAQPAVTNRKDTIGSTTITYQTTCYGKPDSSVSFINVHENENTSVIAAKQVFNAAKKYCVTQLRCRDMRLISFIYKGKTFTVDPNRIYTAKGALASLKKNSRSYNDDVFAAALKLVDLLGKNFTDSFINNKSLVVALHNNTNGEPLSIISYKSGSESQNATDAYINLQQDPDDFFLVTEQSIFDFLKQKGFNVALQDNVHVTDDGSLSVYAAKNRIPYINIEAQVGHIAEQKKMLEAVLECISRRVGTDH